MPFGTHKYMKAFIKRVTYSRRMKSPPATSGSGTDLFGNPSESDLINSLALVPVTYNFEADIPAHSNGQQHFTTNPPHMSTEFTIETKSTVWTDTLNRGLVNLNISGAKINPLADIGIDFDSINRMEKRKEKSSATPVMSTVTMGKAMGSGSGIGRAGGLPPSPNPMTGSGMGMGHANGMGMGMNIGMNQGPQAHSLTGPVMPGVGYNPMMGMGGYTSQQPYGGGGYR